MLVNFSPDEELWPVDIELGGSLSCKVDPDENGLSTKVAEQCRRICCPFLPFAEMILPGWTDRLSSLTLPLLWISWSMG